MRSLRKPLLILAAIVLVVSAGVYATVAFMTDTEEITNTFTVGKVNISLDEAIVDPVSGKPLGGRTDDKNTYHLMPGRTYTKDPTVTVDEGSEDCYVRMVVLVNRRSELYKSFKGLLNLVNYYTPGAANPTHGESFWKLYKEPQPLAKDPANTLVYEFRYHKPINNVTGDIVLEPLFTSFTIPGETTGSDLLGIQDLEIVVQAHAIQSDGFASAEAAWAAFDGSVKSDYIIMPSYPAEDGTLNP